MTDHNTRRFTVFHDNYTAIQFYDGGTETRQQWLADLQQPDESIWWWAVAIAVLAVLVMLVSSVGPVVFPAG